jgi:hypothetical protein
MGANETGNILADLAAKALSGLGSVRDGVRGSAIGSIAGNAAVSKTLGVVDILAHLGAFAGWVDNKTATNIQMAEAAVDYLGGKIDGKTTVANLMNAATDRIVFDKMKEGGSSDQVAKITSVVVSFFVGRIVGYLAGKVEDGIIGKDTSIGKALETLQKGKDGQALPTHTPSGLPAQDAKRDVNLPPRTKPA